MKIGDRVQYIEVDENLKTTKTPVTIVGFDKASCYGKNRQFNTLVKIQFSDGFCVFTSREHISQIG